MDNIIEMNKSIFYNNLMLAINELLRCNDFDESSIKIVITPVFEQGKPLNATDDIMRLVLLNDDNIKNKKFTIKQTVDLLTGFVPLVPIWIDVSLEERSDEVTLIQLKTSLRMRKPSLLRNVESGHPPFRCIFE